MKCRIVYKPDGTVAVIHPAPNSKRAGETEAAWLDRVFTKTMAGGPLDGLPFDDRDTTDLPPNRDDRGAWEGQQGQGITVNATKAAQITAMKEWEVKVEGEERLLAEESLIAKGDTKPTP